jgi:hypothetical protein
MHFFLILMKSFAKFGFVKSVKIFSIKNGGDKATVSSVMDFVTVMIQTQTGPST